MKRISDEQYQSLCRMARELQQIVEEPAEVESAPVMPTDDALWGEVSCIWNILRYKGSHQAKTEATAHLKEFLERARP